jgi:dTDP-4-dehydrorhamnose 3,5-epimerase
MKVTPLPLDGLVLIEIDVLTDDRGFFIEYFHDARFRAAGLPHAFAQDNHSRSRPGVLRGLHYQAGPWQGKLVRVARGRIWDVAVDIRPDSPTFGRSHGIELDEARGRLVWIPGGFAHGFCALGDEPADVIYKVDVPYNPANEGGIHFADPDLSIPWPIAHPIMSVRDGRLPSFADYRRRSSR